jgi:hypothetical protein
MSCGRAVALRRVLRARAVWESQAGAATEYIAATAGG